MNFNDKTLNALKAALPSGFTLRGAQKALGMQDKFSRAQLKAAMETLEQAGDIVYDSKLNKYLYASSAVGVIKGRLIGNSRGFGFVVREDGEDDVFVPAPALLGALHGDTVLIKIVSAQLSEGRVVKVLSRGTDTVVGTLGAGRDYAFVIPDDLRFSNDVFVARDNFNGAQQGDKVVVKLTAYPDKHRRNPEGRVQEVLGRAGEQGVDVLSIIRAFGLIEEFSGGAAVEAKKAPLEIASNDTKGREDLRALTVITIDGEDAKDLDDAISMEKTHNGYRLGVHIADVSHYVKKGSQIDKEAYERGTSVYFPDKVLPMLPKELSNGICSLSGGVDRLTLSLFMDVDNDGKVTDHRFCQAVIKTTHRMTYTAVTKILQGDSTERHKYADVADMLGHCRDLAQVLMRKRASRGSIDFDLPEAHIQVDADGKVLDITQHPRTVSHKIIEEFMILANETVAETIEAFELPFVYRVHQTPSEEKLSAFKEFLQGMGYKIGGRDGKVAPKDFSDLLIQIEGQPVFAIINKVMLRTMMKAQYSPDNIGHFGLASTSYCHFTSPIRRYPDLMVHRIVKLMLSGALDKKSTDKIASSLYADCLHCSEKERMAEEAEREVDDFFKAKYMEDKIGEEFEGVISGVTEFGVFVQLENTVEGLVRLTELPQDSYTYVKNRYALIGTKHTFGLGERLKVRVEGVNLSSKKVDFSVVEQPKDPSTAIPPMQATQTQTAKAQAPAASPSAVTAKKPTTRANAKQSKGAKRRTPNQTERTAKNTNNTPTQVVGSRTKPKKTKTQSMRGKGKKEG